MNKRKTVYDFILVLVTMVILVPCLQMVLAGDWDSLLQVGTGGLFLLLLENWKDRDEE